MTAEPRGDRRPRKAFFATLAVAGLLTAVGCEPADAEGAHFLSGIGEALGLRWESWMGRAWPCRAP